MEISEYDQYVPEKELNMHFRIPRKRTAEESFGAAGDFQDSPCYGGNMNKVPAFGGAAHRPPNYSNYRTMFGSQSPELGSINKLPIMPTRQNISFGNNRFTSQDNMGYIEYPKMNSQNSYNFNKNLDEPRDGPLWLGDPTNSNHFRENKNQLLDSNRDTIGRDWSFRGMPPLGRNRDVPLLGTRRHNIEGDKPLVWNNQNSGRSSFRANIGGGSYYRGNNDFSGNHNDGSSFNGNYNDDGFGQGIHNRKDFRNDNMSNQAKFEFDHSDYNKHMQKKSGSFRYNENQRNPTKRYWNKPDRPKLPKPNIPPVVIPDVSDNTLPKELREMFQPLFCKLCSLQMTSNVMAKMHYVSKNHEKKIRKFLIEHSEKTGEPLHPRATVTAAEKKEKEEDKDPRNFYCELCDLQLTGKQHADSHYMGKSHNAVRMGKKKPAGKGCFDPNGKWIRKSKEESLLAEGDDPFGLDFRKKLGENKSEDTVPKSSGKTREQFTCSLCFVFCVSQEQLNIHFNGSKHKKKLKLNGLSLENFVLSNDPDKKESDIEAVVENDIATVDSDNMLKSKYITPNGFFYCKNCNLTVNSETQFKQHLGSKNHAKKANAKKME